MKKPLPLTGSTQREYDSLQEVLAMERGTVACQNCLIKRTSRSCPKCGYDACVIRIGHEGKEYRFFYDKSRRPYTYTTALQTLITINNEIQEHIFNPNDYMLATIEDRLFQNAFDRFLDKKEAEYAPSNKYRTYYRNHLGYFTDRDVRDIKLKHLDDFYRRKLPAHLSWKYKNNIMACLFAFLRWLLRWGEIKELPTFPELEPGNSAPREAPTYEDQLSALARIPKEHRDIIEFLMESGLRPGEACALKIMDINFMSGKMLIQRTLSAGQIRETTKGHNKTWRTLSSRAYEIIRARSGDRIGDDFVFINPKTKRRYSGEFLRVLWRKHAEIPYELYSNRHGFATQLAETGAGELELQAIMGHADLRSTRRYFRPTTSRQRELLDQRGKEREKVIDLRRRRR
jgi:integrase